MQLAFRLGYQKAIAKSLVVGVPIKLFARRNGFTAVCQALGRSDGNSNSAIAHNTCLSHWQKHNYSLLSTLLYAMNAGQTGLAAII
jgi:hypothetical protein